MRDPSLVSQFAAWSRQKKEVEAVFVVLTGNYNPEEHEEGGMLQEARGASALPAAGMVLWSTPHLEKI